MFRYVPLILVGSLCALAAFAAGISEDVPIAAQVVFVASLAIFFSALLAGVVDAGRAERDLAE